MFDGESLAIECGAAPPILRVRCQRRVGRRWWQAGEISGRFRKIVVVDLAGDRGHLAAVVVAAAGTRSVGDSTITWAGPVPAGAVSVGAAGVNGSGMSSSSR